MPWAARRSMLGVRHPLRPAMVAHCCWSVMMCRMLGRDCVCGDCALAAATAAPVRKLLRSTACDMLFASWFLKLLRRLPDIDKGKATGRYLIDGGSDLSDSLLDHTPVVC